MKSMKIFVISFMLFGLISKLTSCIEPSAPTCTDNLSYETAYNGDCTYRQDIISGNWTISEFYDGTLTGCGSGTDNYTIAISKDPTDKMKVKISNFLNWGASCQVAVDIYNSNGSTNLYLNNFTYFHSGYNYNISGWGTINAANDQIDFTYYFDQQGGSVCNFDCTGTAIKQ